MVALTNTLANRATRANNAIMQQQVVEVKNSLQQIQLALAELNNSNLNAEAKQQILNNLALKMNSALNNVQPNYQNTLSEMDNIVTQYLTNQERLSLLQTSLSSVTDPTQYNTILNEINTLSTINAGHVVQIYDRISYLKHETNLAQSKILEEIANLRRNNLTDTIGDFINEFKDWLNTITYEQNIAVINLFGISLIMFTVVSIVSIFYGNSLLDYLKLEERYPKIAKFIILRRKFQQYYLLINVLIITVVSIIMFVMNLTVFE